MASYRQKYAANFYFPGMGLIQLVILEKNYNGSSFLIGNLQGLSLEVGGGNEPPYAPVIKTTLRLTIADAFDVGTTYNGVTCVTTEGSNRIKNGQWEEFYTNDATKYKVQLIYLVTGSGRPQRQTVFWQGFITPDSWQESMVYRGSITVVARDMLGSLSDYTFDAEGVDGSISVGDLVTLAVQKCGAAMSVSLDADKALRNVTEDVSIFAARIWVKAFEGKSWWTALTETLESLGLVMRYNGNNAWKVVSLRWLPDVQNTESHYAEFINRSGIRTLDPPVKEISSSFALEMEESRLRDPDPDDLSYANSISCVYDSIAPGAPLDTPVDVICFTLVRASGSWAASSTTKTLLSKPYGTIDSSLIDAGITELAPFYFIANSGHIIPNGSGQKAWDYYPVLTLSTAIQGPSRLVIRQSGEIITRGPSSMMLPTTILGANPPELDTVSIYLESGGLYYDGAGEWVAGTEKTGSIGEGLDPITLSFEGGNREVGLDIVAPPGGGTITLKVVHVHVWSALTVTSSAYVNAGGLLVPLSFAMAEPSVSDIATEYSVKTLYNPDYNVRIERTPALGSVNTILPGAILKNVLLNTTGSKALPDSWNFSGASEGYPLEVMVQGQVLMYYAAPLSIFTGSLHDKTFPVAVPFSSYSYFGRVCNVQRGTYDFITGYVRDVALREIMFWGQAWPQFSPNYTVQGRRGKSGGGASGGGTGGGGGLGTNSARITELEQHVAVLDSLIGEDENHDAYVKPREETVTIPPEEEGDDPTTVVTEVPREFKNAGGIHARALTLARSSSPSGTVDLEVITYTDENDVVHEYLHTRLPFASDQDISAGGRGSGGGGGGGGTAVAWGNDAANGYETLVVEGYTGNQRRVALQGHLHAVADIFTGIGTSTPSVGQTLVYGANGWAYGAAGAVQSVVGLTGAITQAQLRTALGLGAAAYRGVADTVSYHGAGLVPAGLLYDELDAVGDAIDAVAADIPTHLGQLEETTTGTGSWHFTTAYKNLLDSLEDFAQMFELLGSGTSADPYLIHAFYPLYSDGYIAAGGRGDGGGGGGGGATYLGQLEDVTLTNPAYRQVLWRNNSGAWVNHRLEVSDIDGLSTQLNGFVTLSTAQTINGTKTFSATILGSGVPNIGSNTAPFGDLYLKGTGKIALSDGGGTHKAILSANGYASGTVLLGFDTKDTHNFNIYGTGLAFYKTINNAEKLALAVNSNEMYSAAGLNLGTATYPWNNAYIKRWYPVQGNSNIYVEYNAEYGAFYFKGNVVASGYIAAGGRGPSET